MRTHYGERSTAASLDAEKCSHETASRSGETHSEESSGRHQEPEENDAVPEPGFYDVMNNFKPPVQEPEQHQGPE
eukprot:12922003-Prorocentrum_lima.AAC.1